MSEMKSTTGELCAMIQITRKATGKVETYELVGQTTSEQHAAIMHGAAGAVIGPGSDLNNQPKE